MKEKYLKKKKWVAVLRDHHKVFLANIIISLNISINYIRRGMEKTT